MMQKVRYNISNRRTPKALSEYTKSRDIRLMKSSSLDNEYFVIIKGEKAPLKAVELQRKLKEAGYVSKLHFRSTYRSRRPYCFRGSFKSPSKSNLTNLNNMLCLKVVAPKPPVDPPVFPNPNGEPVKKPKKKKG
ncbi:MAG: hypothetical protein E7481_04895 [Ruminococcaceae bacterium]|nr:hypothetical protein [Oscillospiraceae bacterium]